jgi:hypothetical protein
MTFDWTPDLKPSRTEQTIIGASAGEAPAKTSDSVICRSGSFSSIAFRTIETACFGVSAVTNKILELTMSACPHPALSCPMPHVLDRKLPRRLEFRLMRPPRKIEVVSCPNPACDDSFINPCGGNDENVSPYITSDEPRNRSALAKLPSAKPTVKSLKHTRAPIPHFKRSNGRERSEAEKLFLRKNSELIYFSQVVQDSA